ncbi:BamA/TamA family outer membrane protein [Paenirhodobacter enshiensis]|uniref:BamA/TamA family outer membrane protein n=1 Tax=Paenirhodobacter enshiensis TaxID=1105367 RepID=UPI00068A0D12|nr:BamA/TamA family outer membrane protein [Paenirhodobacter enshiensis]
MHVDRKSKGACLALVSAAAIVPCLLGAGAVAEARSFDTVTVRGTKMVSQDQVRAACDIAPGTDYSDEDLHRIETCLTGSGVFTAARVSAEGKTLVVDVTEKPLRPGRVSFGIAYDSDDGIVGSVFFERYNLFPNTYGSIDMRLGAESQSLATTAYYSGDTPGRLDFGLDAGFLNTTYDDQSFDHRVARVEGYLAHVDPAFGRFEGGLGYRRDSLDNVDADASALIRAEEGSVVRPYTRFSYSVHSDQSVSTLTAPAYEIRFDQYFWNIGDEHALADSRVSMQSSFPLAADTLLMLSFQGGALTRQGSASTRIVDRYQLGGAMFRGFSPRGIGPKDGGDFLGGNYFSVSSIDVQRSVGEVFHTPTRIGAFASAGSVWGLNDTLGGAIDDGEKLRSAVGVSVTFDVHGAPLSLYLAKATEKEKGDDTQSFGLSFSARF